MPSLSVEDQSLADDGRLLVRTVTVADPAWLVIHAYRNGQVGEILGFAALAPGRNDDVIVTIDPLHATATVVAMIHMDENEVSTFEFPGPDGPLMEEESVVSAAFTLEPQFALPTIAVLDQAVSEEGLVQIQRVIMTEAGWVLIHTDDSGSVGQVVGFAHLDAGISENVEVPIAWREGTPRLYAVLYQDEGLPRRLEEDVDRPLLVGGEPVVLAFNVTLPPDVFVLDQPVVNGEVVFERVMVDQASWLVIYFDDEGNMGRIIGSAPLAEGVNENVVVSIVEGAATPLLHVLIHEDSVAGDEFGFPAVDRPRTYGGRLPAPFTFRTNPGNYLVTRDQSLKAGEAADTATITVSFAVVDSPTWLVIQAEADGEVRDIVGTRMLAAGINRDVTVEIDAERVTDTLYAALHLDAGESGQFEFPEGPDIPLRHSGSPIQSPIMIMP